jgi:hypothetical protein
MSALELGNQLQTQISATAPEGCQINLAVLGKVHSPPLATEKGGVSTSQTREPVSEDSDSLTIKLMDH